jgi:mannose-1-phosphate guanylyltransferase
VTHAIVLAGGRGERFWPLSRAGRAKQFLPLVGEKTLLAATVERIAPLVAPWRLAVVTGRDQADAVLASLPGLPPEHVLTEPVGRNTAPAVALGAAWARRRDPEAVLLVVPSDAWVGDDAAYRAALAVAVDAATREEALITLGVVPTRPETGYGYLEMGEAAGDGPPLHRVARFVEKPDAPKALEYLAGGRHLWNCGIFVMRARVFLAALERHLPEVFRALEEMDARGFEAPGAREAFYAAVPSVSIDYGVMEKAENVLTVRSSFPWDDLGSWPALERVLPAEEGVVARGEVLAVECPGSVIYAEEGVVAALGVKDLVIVRTRDATLVVPKERAQEVRALVQRLGGRDEWRRYL